MPDIAFSPAKLFTSGERLPAIKSWLLESLWTSDRYRKLSPEQYLRGGEEAVCQLEELLSVGALEVWNELEADFVKSPREKSVSANVVAARLFDVCGIFESSECRRLDQGIDVERLANFFQLGDNFGMADPVAEPKPSQTINFGEGSHEKKVAFATSANFRKQVERFIQEFNVGFVQR